AGGATTLRMEECQVGARHRADGGGPAGVLGAVGARRLSHERRSVGGGEIQTGTVVSPRGSARTMSGDRQTAERNQAQPARTYLPATAALGVRYWFLISLCVGLGLTLSFPAFFAPWTALLEPRLTVALALFLTAWTMPGRSLAGELRQPLPSLWA